MYPGSGAQGSYPEGVRCSTPRAARRREGGASVRGLSGLWGPGWRPPPAPGTKAPPCGWGTEGFSDDF